MCICFVGEGEVGVCGGLCGDFYIFIFVCLYEIFECDGLNLYCCVLFFMVQVVFGCFIQVLMIEGGKVEMKILEGVQIGCCMWLCGKGMFCLCGGNCGDMIVELFVEILCNLCDCQKELLKEFCDFFGDNCNFDSVGFFNWVKQFWDDVIIDDGCFSV